MGFLRQSSIVFSLTAFATLANAQVSIVAPEQIGIGAELSVRVVGSVEARTFVTLVAADTQEGGYAGYAYAVADRTEQDLALRVLSVPGSFEIRVLGPDSPYPTIVRKAIEIVPVEASLSSPEQVDAGAVFPVTWAGPDNDRDYIAIAEPDSADRSYLSYVYTQRGSPLELTAPEHTGEYEIRYLLGNDDTVIGRVRFSVGAVSASLDIPSRAEAGSTLEIGWSGPNNMQDFITVVESGAAERSYQHYVYTSRGSPAILRLPDVPGSYEIRYLTGRQYSTLASANIDVTATTASVDAAPEAIAGTLFDVSWEGPANDYDYITIVRAGAPQGTWENYTYTYQGTPLQLRAPSEPGDYEVRYATGQNHTTLATTGIRITPSSQQPGTVLVTVAQQNPDGVEVILDASGSMLQRLGNQRRIEIARNTLTELTQEIIPPGTPFALRVFGREVDSCQTDLVSPLAPLDATAMAAVLSAIEAQNNARTPIADSLARVESDLREVTGERLVIVLTDGEETCGGDPAAVIESLVSGGTQIRINIVGFAIDDQMLESTFAQWASAGNGHYFSASDPEGLNRSLQTALMPAFLITDSDGNTVVEGIANGEPVSMIPGDYQVRLLGKDETRAFSVTEATQTSVTF